MAAVIGIATQDLAHPSAHAIPLHRASEASSSGNAKAVVVAAIGHEADDHEPVRPRTTIRADAREVLPRAERQHGPQPRLCAELLAAACSPGGKHVAPSSGLHALAEAMFLGAMALLGLIRLLRHWGLGSFRQTVGTISWTGLPVRM